MNSREQALNILGLNQSATKTEIKKSFNEKAMQFHPDKNQTPGSDEIFKKLNSAYHHLLNDVQPTISYQQLVNNVNAFLNPYGISTSCCDIFEETMLKIAAIETTPKKCRYFQLSKE